MSGYAEMIDQLVARDRIHPRSEEFGRIVGVSPRMNSQEGFLQ